jgi:hypothetical protein
MKFTCILLAIYLYTSSIANAQELNYDLIKGTWEYKSPEGKTKLSYKFDVDKKFNGTIEHDETELKTEGLYEFDKKGDLDRLKLTTADPGNSTRTQITYHLIKIISADTIKVQNATDKQTTWSSETSKNTMVFIRKKEKEKPKD